MTQKSTIDKIFQRSTIALTLSHTAGNDRELLKVSDTFCALTGYDREECIGRDCRFLQGGDRKQAARFELHEALSRQEDIEVVLRNYTKRGEPFDNLLFIRHIHDLDGKVVYILGSQFLIPDHESAENLNWHLNALEADFATLAESQRMVQHTVRRQLSKTASTMLHSAILRERMADWLQR